MTAKRRARILEQLFATEGSGPNTARLCEVCARVTGLSGAGIMLMSGNEPWGSVCTTDPVSALIEDLQYTLGEGPCVDASQHGRPVLEPDLASPKVARWPAFAGPALDAGVRALFGFPLQVGGVRLGALNLYRTAPGPLTDDQHADALVLSEVAAEVVLVMQSKAPPGALAAELEVGGDFKLAVHQAAGMVAAQLNVTVGEALIRLRAFAFAEERPLNDVADDVVARRLRFNDSDDYGAGESHEPL